MSEKYIFKGSWIGADMTVEDRRAPVFKKKITIEKEPEKAELIQSVIGTLGFTEAGLPYPLTAKYHMNLCGIPTENIARNRKSEELTLYSMDCMKQMKLATDYFEKIIEGE